MKAEQFFKFKNNNNRNEKVIESKCKNKRRKQNTG